MKVGTAATAAAMRIACIGGGPAGLYFSILVKKARPDWSVTVIERYEAGDTFGWGVVFSDKTIDGLREADPESYDRILTAFRRWDDIDVFFKGRRITSSGHGFSGIARKALIAILHARATALGVEFQFGTEAGATDDAFDIDALAQTNDLVVGADGVNSVVRRSAEAHFNPRSECSRSRYMWLGTEQKLDAFTFDFQQTDAGWFTLHAYRFDDAMSTVVIEVPETTWRRAGLDVMAPAESIRFCEQLFAERLGGHRLIARPVHPRGSAVWLSFNRVLCERWYCGNRVLLGDAAHTTHFSIGSGTKLAMEDAMALAGTLTSECADGTGTPPWSLTRRLQRYQYQRESEVLKLQTAAINRMNWFENVELHADMAPEQFAYSLLTGSERVGHRNLTRRDPTFIAEYEAWYAQIHKSETGPPRLTPLCLRGLTLKNRLVCAPGAETDAGLILFRWDGSAPDSWRKRMKEVRHRGASIGLQIDVAGDACAAAHCVEADLLDIRFDLDRCVADDGQHAFELLAAVREIWPVEKPVCIGFSARNVTSSYSDYAMLSEHVLSLMRRLNGARTDLFDLVALPLSGRLGTAGVGNSWPMPGFQPMYGGVSSDQIRNSGGVGVLLEFGEYGESGDKDADLADTLIASGRADLCLLPASYKSR